MVFAGNTGVCYFNTDQLSLLDVNASESRGTEKLGSALNAKRKGSTPYSSTFATVARLAGLTCPGRIVLARHLCTPCAVRTGIERDIGLGRVACGRSDISGHSARGAIRCVSDVKREKNAEDLVRISESKRS
jgi:hypothetical protein